ncbi:MAG: hypothetical protein ACFFAN_01710 [Promethearchaeota archaeon]
MKSWIGKITKRKSGHGKYESMWIYIPSKLAKHKSFPFSDKENVSIEIKNNKLVISKSNRRNARS